MSVTINREFKDRLFKFIFGREENKEYILSLYNALNSSNYTNPDDIEINTLEDVVYISMKNDVSFLLDSYLSLWEQQSTFNPNMPLRGLMYFGKFYSAYVEPEDRKGRLYSKSRLMIPTPRFVVFYTGSEKQDPVTELKLSDAFMNPDKTGNFEWTATMYNLNDGKNDELLKKCRLLGDYMHLINLVNEFKAENLPAAEAVDMAVKQCISEGVLDEFLKKHRAEVADMFLTEFDEKAYWRGAHDEGFDEGFDKGKAEGLAEGLAGLVCDGLLALSEAAKRSGMSEEEFKAYLAEYEKRNA